MKSGIYYIFNKVNGKVYVGSAVDIKKRWREHRHYLRKGTHPNSYFQAAWNKHGEENFGFAIVQICSENELTEFEQSWIDWTKCCDRKIGYNILSIANSSLGYKHTPEALAKMAAKSIGTKQSAETIARKIASMSRPDKWPCATGSRCRCDRCRLIKNEYALNWMRNRNSLNVLQDR